MRTFILALLLLPVAVFADEVRVSVGQSRDEFVATIKKHGATDITPGMEIVGPRGEHPVTGIIWQFADYDAVIQFSVRDTTVVHITYWTKKDFGESKSHRAKTEQSITALKLDTKTREVSIEKKKQANKITGPNAGGPRQFSIRTPLTARVGQFWRSACCSLEASEPQ